MGEHDKEKICHDVLNTSVMAAIIGGFALSNLQSFEDPDYKNNIFDLIIYLFSNVAVRSSRYA